MFRESQDKGRLRLRHLLEHAEAVGESIAIEVARFERLKNEDARPRAVSSFNLFQTPEPLADQLAALLGQRSRVLEPSAGLGRLYRAARLRSDCPMVLVELSPECASELYRATERDDACRLVQADFLACDAQRLGGLFDGVIMNPPFKMGTDIKHITHARTLLSEGGRLVSLCASGPRQRAALMPIADQWHELPAGSFKSEGTNVNAAIIVIDR